MSEKGFQRRLLVCGVLLTLCMAGLGARLTELHLGPHEDVRQSVLARRHVQRKLPFRRGSISCSDGANVLALDVAAKDVCGDPRALAAATNDVFGAAARIAGLLQIPVEEVAPRLANFRRQYVCLQRQVPIARAAEVKALNVRGIFFEDAVIRFYPQRMTLCHTVGFVDHNGQGRAGVEQKLEGFLKGTEGLVETELDARRREVYSQRTCEMPAIAGANVSLTIDANIQYVVERALDDAMAEFSARGAWAIVQRVRTGEVLALASRPGFDPNDLSRVTEDQRMNRCIGFTYEPGSTFKALTFAAAINDGLVAPEEPIDCENGTWHYAGRPLRDYHPYGVLSVEDALKKSSNIAAAKIALKLGERRFNEYLRAFGIGTPLGIELPGEQSGLLRPPERWARIDITRMAMGHSVSVTALQLLNVFCTLANDGVMMRPYLVSQVTDGNGTVLLRRGPTVLGARVRPETAATMRRLLGRVTDEGGTGVRARVEGYEVAGKTGTADKPVNGVYTGERVVSSFVGFLPAGRPEIGIVVVVDEPTPHHTGGRVAAPTFCRIAQEAVRRLNVPPDGSGEPREEPAAGRGGRGAVAGAAGGWRPGA
jgi:cell division protein FtsI (penicillin-binding protein 3)